jgi:muramoyltetrapeptide carboxypeptidase
MFKPNHLQRGDSIGAVSPSSPMAGLLPHRVEQGVKMLEKLGFVVKIGEHALSISQHTAGGPKERADDINSFFRDESINAIISFIGGNHSNQILEHLDFDLIMNNPKIFMGYLDTTVLHFALHTQSCLVSFYGPSVLTQFAENPRILPYTEEYLEKAIMSSKPIGKVNPSMKWTDEILDWFTKKDLERPRRMKKNVGWQWLRQGRAKGPIFGGCISSMMHLRGTEYWPNFSGNILFWEIPESDCNFSKGESPENIDTYLTNLDLSGTFSQISGMIVGRPFGYTKKETTQLVQLIKERTKKFDFPILFNVDIGHTDPMITVPLGTEAIVDSYKDLLEFNESGVR